MTRHTGCLVSAATLLVMLHTRPGIGENWPRWRGPLGNGVSSESVVPVQWSRAKNILWKTVISGEGSSSPIVFGNRVVLTSARDDGLFRAVHCLDAGTGRLLWTREIEDENPELTSAVTGHAAPTAVTDGERIIAWFGNAGVVCFDFAGVQLWRRSLGSFDTELGIASSPILRDGRVILVCDHDGTAFKTFDSFLISLDVKTGRTVWKTRRKRLFRSWSTPIVVNEHELVVNAQDELRGYAVADGALRWRVTGMTGWVTPSPVFARGMIFATSGRNGPMLAVRPGGRGDVTVSHMVWRHPRGAPYVCSPLVYQGLVFVHSEQGLLTCFEAASGKQHYRVRLGGKFIASAVAAGGYVYFTDEKGTTHVVKSQAEFSRVAKNQLAETVWASPAISSGRLLLRSGKRLWCVAPTLR